MTAKIIRMLLSISLLLPLMSGASTRDRTAIARKYLAQEKNDAIRAAAVECLKYCKQPECKKSLRDALHDASGTVRYRAIESLEPSADMIGLFIELLKDTDDRVWLCAVNGLTRIYTNPDPKKFLFGAADELIKLRTPLLEALKLAASDKDPFVREGAIAALGEIVDTASDNDPNMRNGLIVKVNVSGGHWGWHPSIKGWLAPECEKKKIANKELGNILLRALHDEDVNVRRDATEKYACFDSPEALDALLKNAEDPEPDIRVAALSSLKGYSDSRVIASAFRALRDPQEPVRQAAGYLLHKQLTAAHTEKLRVLLNDQNQQIRCNALDLAAELPYEQINQSLISMFWMHPADLAACKEVERIINRPQITQVVFDIANSSNDNAFLAKISQMLQYQHDPTLMPAYLNALRNSRHAIIRRMAAQVLSESFESKEKTNSKILAPFYADSDPIVRFWAASFGAGIKDEKAVPILEQSANNPEEEIRVKAIAGLANFMPATFDYLSSLLLRNSEALKADSINTILYILKSSGKTDFITVLMSALQSKNPDIVANALAVLCEVDGKAAQLQFRKLLENDNLQIRVAAIEAIRSKAGVYFEDPKINRILGSIIADEKATINRILGSIIADEKVTEETRIRALNAAHYTSETAESPGIKNILYSVLKKANTPHDLKLRIAGVLKDPNNPGKIIKDMLDDRDLCNLVSLDAYNLAFYVESPYDDGNGIMPLSDVNIEKLPRNCRIGIAGNLSKIGKIKDPDAIEDLQKIGKHNDPAIRAAVAAALGRVSSTMTLPLLNKLAQDTDPDVREKAKTSIGMIERQFPQKAN